jgi:hypothetical protein
MIPAARIVHETPARLRIQIPSKRGDAAYFDAVAQDVSDFPTVTAVRVNPRTAGALLEHSGISKSGLAQYARQKALFELQTLHAEPHVMLGEVSNRVQAIDTKFRTLTHGDLDIRSLVFLGLIALGIRQMMQGNFVVPAVSAFWYALQIVDFGKGLPKK